MSFLQNLQNVLGGQGGGLGDMLGSALGQNAGQGGPVANASKTGASGSGLGDLVGSIFGGQGAGTPAAGQGNPLGGLLGPAALGGLAAILFSGSAGRKVAGNALLMGGGAALVSMLWKKYKGKIPQIAGTEQTAPLPSAPEDRAVRLVKAMIFAAKSDGHIDDDEKAAIQSTVTRLQLGQDLQNIVDEALNAELNPAVLAEGIKTPDEALEVYMVSCSVISPDSIMETAYLDALAKALGIREDVTKGIAGDIKAGAPA